MVICRNFLGLWLVNTEKPVSPRDSDIETFPEGEENQSTKRKPKVALVKAFSAVENEN